MSPAVSDDPSFEDDSHYKEQGKILTIFLIKIKHVDRIPYAFIILLHLLFLYNK